MPFCPVCKCEYVEGVNRCLDCDVDLVAQLHEEIVPQTNEDLVCVFQTYFHMESAVVKDMLESSEIAVFEQQGFTINGRPMDSAMEFRLHVLESQAEEAKKLIAAGHLEYQSAGEEDQFLIEDQPESEYNQK